MGSNREKNNINNMHSALKIFFFLHAPVIFSRNNYRISTCLARNKERTKLIGTSQRKIKFMNLILKEKYINEFLTCISNLLRIWGLLMLYQIWKVIAFVHQYSFFVFIRCRACLKWNNAHRLWKTGSSEEILC